MSTTSDKKYAALEAALSYSFKNKTVLETALTHASVLKKNSQTSNNERLEFLGDRVLGLAVATMLYQAFPDEKEGALAKRHAVLVQESTLSGIADKINLAAYLKLSPAEVKAGGLKNKTILADALEAMMGAIYLDGGFENALAFIQAIWSPLVHTGSLPPQDPKTQLQELAQSKGLPLPHYRVVARTGTDHKPLFTIEVSVEKLGSAQAEAPSKRAAEKMAAQLMLDKADIKT